MDKVKMEKEIARLEKKLEMYEKDRRETTRYDEMAAFDRQIDAISDKLEYLREIM